MKVSTLGCVQCSLDTLRHVRMEGRYSRHVRQEVLQGGQALHTEENRVHDVDDVRFECH
jgi:hypothetical protein